MAQRLSQLASELWPFLLPKVGAMVQGAAGGGGVSGGGSVGLHDLSGSLHKGTLADAQAPQFLLRSGARSLTGSLLVDAGITIDGVDISAHAADINAHHAKLHAITDAANHSATGALQYQIVGIPTAGALGYLTPKSSPAANEIVKTDGTSAVTLVDLTVTSDLFMSGYLDFGTDTMYEDASYLQVTGSKAVRFGQNIGNANWTVYNAGGASFGGSVDIISGGDLTVIGSGSYAGSKVIFADSSGGNVGIMMTPDPQFALDINGPARATYWIGPHAIQLKGVLLLAHYDGRAPYETNYSGEPNGHMGQVATVTGGVIYRPGKFYKALQTAPATTNQIINPSFELNTANWGTDYSGTTTITNPAGGVYGSAYAKVVSSGTLSNFYSNAVTATNSTSYTVSFWFRCSGTVTAIVREYGTSTNLSSETLTATTQWTRYIKTVTTPASGTNHFRIAFNLSNGAILEIDAVQAETGAFVTPYCDGSLGDGHAWTVPASPHASTSTRTASTFRYPVAGNIDATKGTIMLWVYADAWNSDGDVLWQAGNVNAELDAYVIGSGALIFRINSVSLTATTGNLATKTWHHLAFTWDAAANTIAVYVNGAAAGTSTAGGAIPTLDTAIGVGYSAPVGTACNHNGYIDDFCILDRVMPAAEIRSVYESNAPVFAESSVFSFRPTPKGLIWADDEGLWMRDTVGKPVLGVYGGEAATKNWGGFNLVPGDLLLGNNAVGSSAIWWSRVNGTFGFYGAGSGTPQVEIATDGRLTAGGGKVALDSTGFKAYNASSVETININANGIYMGDGGGRTTVASWTSGNRLRWYNVGESYEATPETYLDDSSISRTLYPLVIRAIRQGNDAGLVEISAVNTSNVGAFLRVGEGFRLKDYYGTPYNTNRMVHLSATDIILEATNLQLRSLTTSGTAVGSYSGKIRIQINGTNYYIPYYAS